MPAQHFIVATAGHVDHGKSALVKALTGTDPDRLPEEKARGITIDLGFAHLELPAPAKSETSPEITGAKSLSPRRIGSEDTPPLPGPLLRPMEERESAVVPCPTMAGSVATPTDRSLAFSIGLVDVPGHEDFVKNMVAGVGSIDLALLVVAADDGWMPQTEEHLQILGYAGVRHAVVALTKIDLAEGREADAISKLRESLRDSPFETAPIVGTSVITGRGIDELKIALSTTLAAMPPPRDIGKPRLPIDRVFTLRGIGTVVTGTLSGGILRRNQAVIVQPSGQATRIRSLQSHNRDADQTGPGTRTALNLPDLAPAAESADGVTRGQVVTIAELGGPASTIDVWLEKTSRLIKVKAAAARPLKDGALVRMHHGSGNLAARVLLLDRTPLAPGGRAFAQFRFEQPVFVLGGDRFILRDWAEQTTLGGGLVLEADAARDAFRSATRREFLEQRAAAPDDPRVWAAAQLARDRAVRRATLLLKTRFAAKDIHDAVAQLVVEKQVVVAGDWLADAQWWREVLQTAAGAIQVSHRDSPEKPGLDVNELRRHVDALLPGPELFDVLVAELCRTAFVQAGTAVRHRSHQPALPPKLQAAGAKLRAALAVKPFEPPPRKELAPDALAQQALRFLLDTGEAMEVSGELVMQAESYARAREGIVNFLRGRGKATASELRQHLDTNRRVVIPLLEKLDRDGVTRRDGDVRVLR